MYLALKGDDLSRIKSYSDADWAGSIIDRKSTSGFICYLGSAPLHWATKKQNCVSASSFESEYIALSQSWPYQTRSCVTIRQPKLLQKAVMDMYPAAPNTSTSGIIQSGRWCQITQSVSNASVQARTLLTLNLCQKYNSHTTDPGYRSYRGSVRYNILYLIHNNNKTGATYQSR